MPHFKKRLQTDFGSPLFHFNRLFTPRGVKYHVAVLDEEQHHVFFNMEVDKGHWRIIEAPKVPDWIKQLESELSQAIIDHKPIDLT
jgi:hypothetical protein